MTAKLKKKMPPSDQASLSQNFEDTLLVLAAKNYKIALIAVTNPAKKFALNKDLNGGFGTADDFKGFFGSGVARWVKKRSVRLPIISLAILQALLKGQGHHVHYFEGRLPETGGEFFDLMLIYGTIVDYSHEIKISRMLKQHWPQARIGFFGSFPTAVPALFSQADFVVVGEIESFFMQEFRELNQLTGIVHVKELTDFDALPTMDLDTFPIDQYGYSWNLIKKCLIPYQGSKGCPYSCRYYCTYGQFQGPKVRQRQAAKIVGDLGLLQRKYGIEAVQFRDPVFGLKKGFIEEFCREITTQRVKIQWGVETRLDLLNEDLLQKMYEAGLRILNVGIETRDSQVARHNKRPLVAEVLQERLIKACGRIGIKVSAFYILGQEADTPQTIEETIRYAIYLNTPVARFAVATPYPGTDFYRRLEEEKRLLTTQYELYNQNTLVWQHPHFTPDDMQKIFGSAYRRYYLRPAYLENFLKWQWREYRCSRN